jgi:hypothetical protein
MGADKIDAGEILRMRNRNRDLLTKNHIHFPKHKWV